MSESDKELVLAAIEEGHELGLYDIQQATGLRLRRITRAVDALLGDGFIVDRWASVDGPRNRRMYRVTAAAPTTCQTCDDYGVMDGLEPCPENCARSVQVMAGLRADHAAATNPPTVLDGITTECLPDERGVR